MRGLIFIAFTFFYSFSFAEDFGSSKCYETNDMGRQISRPVVFPMADRELTLSKRARIRLTQEDFLKLHNVCRTKGKCQLATGWKRKPDPDQKDGWNETHVESVTCENDLGRAKGRWKNSYNRLVTDKRLDPFVPPGVDAPVRVEPLVPLDEGQEEVGAPGSIEG